MKIPTRVGILFAFASFLIVSCATYYQKNLVFQQHFANGEIEEASKALEKNKKAKEDRNRLLYFLQKGVVSQMIGDFEGSNSFFEEAYIFGQDYKKSYSMELASILTNPMLKPYTGEDHEMVLLHYYKVLNFLRLGQMDAALVECRRINIKINAQNDRYGDKKNRYKRDAFGLNLMGIVYEASGDKNNAFIAYRNAYEVYAQDYQSHFANTVPQQLKEDLIRMAKANGFQEELTNYETLFEMSHDSIAENESELLFFWHNGLGPVKDEWSINFMIEKGEGGGLLFVNEELGLVFPALSSSDEDNGLGDLKFVRVAFPKYLERPPLYNYAKIQTTENSYPLQLAEPINNIAFATLNDRMLRELGTSLLRLALKQVAEEQARNEDESIGALVSVINALTEKADTRNWQTLPYSISYARIPLNEGKNKVILNISHIHSNAQDTISFEFAAKKGQTLFHHYHSLESGPLQMN